MAGISHGQERAIRNLETPEAHIRLVNFSLRFDELETRGAFVGGRAGGSALGGLAAVNEDILIALESANAHDRWKYSDSDFRRSEPPSRILTAVAERSEICANQQLTRACNMISCALSESSHLSSPTSEPTFL